VDIRGKKLVVIGGAGLIGSHTVDLLTKEEGGFPVAESVAKRVISLPMHVCLDMATQQRIVDVVTNEGAQATA